MSPHILLSYATSEWLGILLFNVPNLVAQVHIDAISLPTSSSFRKTNKDHKDGQLQGPPNYPNPTVTLQSLPLPVPVARERLWKQKQSPSGIQSKTIPLSPTHLPSTPTPSPGQPSRSLGLRWQRQAPPLWLQSALKPHTPDLSKLTISPNAVARDIVALKCTSPSSIGNMPKSYTIRTDPNKALVQHARRKVPIDYQEQIECNFNDMVTKGVVVPVSQPAKWASSLTYPHKPDGLLCICLDPKDLNKAIVWKHYKAPTLEEISHWLNSATS